MLVGSDLGFFHCRGLVRSCSFKTVTVLSVFGVLECHGPVRCWGFSLSRSGPLLGFWNVTSDPLLVFLHCPSLFSFWGSGVSRSVAFRMFHCHGLVRFWSYGVSRSGPLVSRSGRFFSLSRSCIHYSGPVSHTSMRGVV